MKMCRFLWYLEENSVQNEMMTHANLSCVQFLKRKPTLKTSKKGNVVNYFLTEQKQKQIQKRSIVPKITRNIKGIMNQSITFLLVVFFPHNVEVILFKKIRFALTALENSPLWLFSIIVISLQGITGLFFYARIY